MSTSHLVQVMTRKLVPFVMLFGLYLIYYGHISPGGGFQGGAVLASAIILTGMTLPRNEKTRASQLHSLRVVEISLFLVFLCIGAAGILLGQSFLSNIFPNPLGVIVLNIIIGIKVGAGMGIVCLLLIGESSL